MKDYATAQQVLNNRISRKLENNTYLKRIDDNTIGVLLHETFVVTYKIDKTILTSGGWRTPTTKDRINKYSPLSIYQKNSVWYFDVNNSLFYDGVEIKNNKIIKPLSNKKTDNKLKEIKILKAKIKKYIDKAIIEVKAGLPMPGGGDCWYCVMRTKEGKTLGDSFNDNDHLIQHIKEGYIVPALLWDAVKAHGYQYPEIILGYDQDTMKSGNNCLEFGIRQSLKSYFNKRLLSKIL